MRPSRRSPQPGGRALSLTADVTDEQQLAAATGLQREFGPLTAAVNSAGIANTQAAEKLERTCWQQLIDINLTGVFLSCQAEGRAMLTGRGGAIVNGASMSGTIVNRGLEQARYNTVKALRPTLRWGAWRARGDRRPGGFFVQPCCVLLHRR